MGHEEVEEGERPYLLVAVVDQMGSRTKGLMGVVRSGYLRGGLRNRLRMLVGSFSGAL
jgi:hypothetical protein